jgi:membrane protease YdiL (CAAX protease family)
MRATDRFLTRRTLLATRRRARVELAVFAILFEEWVRRNLSAGGFQEYLYATAAAIAMVYVIAYSVRYRGVLNDWGLRMSGIADGLLVSIGLCLVSFLPLMGLGSKLASLNVLPALDAPPAAYLVWCLLQDFIFFSFCARHLETAFSNTSLACLGAGFLFGISHLPFGYFAAITFLGGVVWAWLFLKTRCLLPVVACHWILGLALLVRPA